MTDSLSETYETLLADVLEPVSVLLEEHIRKLMSDVKHIDRISARAKSLDRFITKSEKTEGSELKYNDPLVEIQDQIGVRITVLYKQDVPIIRKIVLGYLTAIEVEKKQPSTESAFGYFGEHFIVYLPDDVVPEGLEDRAPEFFELQVKTLFQHAWSEANHDLGYKTIRDLSSDEKRKIAFSAAQAWGADEIFSDLAAKLVRFG